MAIETAIDEKPFHLSGNYGPVPDELTRFMQGESKRWAEAVKLSGFKAGE